MPRKRCTLLAAGLLICTPSLLFAQSLPSDDAAAQSRLHFDRGVQAYKDGSLNSALAEFSRAYELTHDFRLLYNVAQVEAERHEYVRAIEVFTEYLKQGSSAIGRERRAEVDTEVARLRTRVGELWVSANTGAEVWIGNHLAAKLPLSTPILVNSGPCVIRVTSPGYKSVTRELAVAGGDRPRLELELEPEASANTGPKYVRNNTALWVSLAATGAFAAGGGIFALLAKNADETLDKRLNTFPSDGASIDKARTTLRTDALVCDILLGAAVVSAGVSTYFLLNPKYKTVTTSGTAEQRPSAQLVATPTGLILKGSF